MAPPTNEELNAKREKNCFAITAERKYYKDGEVMIKRSLRPTEWQKHNGYMHVPLFNTERILNEGECLRFLAENTDLPLPRLYACFEDDGAAYLITEYIEGVGMNELDAEKQDIVASELRIQLEALSALKSNKWGGPTGAVLPPYRIMRKSDGRPLSMRPRETQDLVFCHNDLSAHNVIVNPESLKIQAIIDWEYAGYYPPQFEAEFFRRLGPSVALDGEVDDTEVLMGIISNERCE